MPDWLWYFTLNHVAISLIAIASGFYAFFTMLQSRASRRWTNCFLTFTVLTSVTGFGFPFHKVTPGHVFGVLSLIALGIAIYALRVKQLAGRWRAGYLLSAVFSQYLNVFVLIVQSFQKIPALHSLAPTQSEPPFAIAQGVTLIGFIALTVALLRTKAPEKVLA